MFTPMIEPARPKLGNHQRLIRLFNENTILPLQWFDGILYITDHLGEERQSPGGGGRDLEI